MHSIDLTLEKGKIYGLIGRNGAGKTTLLSILTSQNPATEGSVTFDEMQVWELIESSERAAYDRQIVRERSFLTQNTYTLLKYKIREEALERVSAFCRICI